MKTTALSLRVCTAVLLFLAASLQCKAYNNVYIKAEAYPMGSGTVYVSAYGDDEYKDFRSTYEFKASQQYAQTFIYGKPEGDYQLAGFARDNGNNMFDDGVDEQIRVNNNTGFFTAVYDPKQYDGNGSTTQAQNEANQALELMTDPTDHIYAVFTLGAVAFVADGCEDMGIVTASKLDNAVGDKVTFTAKADKNCHFVNWTDVLGKEVGKSHQLTVTVEGQDYYMAHFAEGAEDPEGIAVLKADEAAGAAKTFDLHGRRLANLSRKGIYVRGGKKYVVR